MSSRTESLKNSVFAKDASTVIPQNPISGQSYRDEAYNATAAGSGWPFFQIVNSANFNQIMFQISGLLNHIEKYGIPLWSQLTDYPVNGICRDNINYKLYVATAPSGPSNGGYKQPSTETSYWNEFSLGDLANKMGINLEGITAVAKNLITSYFTPDEANATESLVAATEYTVTRNGWVVVTGGWANFDGGQMTLRITNIATGNARQTDSTIMNHTSSNPGIIQPVFVGEKYNLFFVHGITVTRYAFVPFIGSN